MRMNRTCSSTGILSIEPCIWAIFMLLPYGFKKLVYESLIFNFGLYFYNRLSKALVYNFCHLCKFSTGTLTPQTHGILNKTSPKTNQNQLSFKK